MERPTVAAITRHPTGGGIAVVSDLLWRVCSDEWGGRAQLLTTFDHENRPATTSEKLRFSLSLLTAEAFGRTDWVLFSHLGLVQAQAAMPPAVRCRYGVFLHGIEAWGPLTRTAERALADADLRIANSRYTAHRIMAAHPSVGSVDVCPLALPPSAQHPSSQDRQPVSDPAPQLRLGPHVVLVVGRMAQAERYKGHDQLIEAWPQVVVQVPDAQLLIVGSGDDRQRLERKAAESSVAPSIVFTGFVDASALHALYERAAVFALPSRGEGFGLVYLEAMAHRLPCIGSTHDAAGEVIVDDQTGRLVEQDDLSAMAYAVSSLLEDEAGRRQMGLAGHERLSNVFSFDRFRRRILDLMPRRDALSRISA